MDDHRPWFALELAGSDERGERRGRHGASPLVDEEAAVGVAVEGEADVRALGQQSRPLSELTAAYERYAASGEINSTVDDAPGRMAAVREHFADEEGVTVDELDGLTVDLPDGAWFNLRASNTEPLLRLNVEAADADRMAEVRDQVLGMVRA